MVRPDVGGGKLVKIHFQDGGTLIVFNERGFHRDLGLGFTAGVCET